jgi:hypothetical protein
MSEVFLNVGVKPDAHKRHPKCLGFYDAFLGEHNCEYDTKLTCEECKYCNAGGRKDPAAKYNAA